MISISNLFVASFAANFSSREAGRAAFEQILAMMKSSDAIQLDFDNRSLTPSFADECIGGLAAHLGLAEVKRRIKLQNIDDISRPLVRHVVLRRSQIAA